MHLTGEDERKQIEKPFVKEEIRGLRRGNIDERKPIEQGTTKRERERERERERKRERERVIKDLKYKSCKNEWKKRRKKHKINYSRRLKKKTRGNQEN